MKSLLPYLIISLSLLSIFIISIYRLYKNRKLKHKIIDNNPYVVNSYIVPTITACNDVIEAALGQLIKDNKLEICKNQRQVSEILKSIRQGIRHSFSKTELKSNLILVHLNYMIESAEKISEISRFIVTHPESYIPITDKCEVTTIQYHISSMMSESIKLIKSDTNPEDISFITNNKDFITSLIAIHSKSMNHDDFNDGTIAYSYLMLLYYLHSFINSFQYVIKKTMIISMTSQLHRQ